VRSALLALVLCGGALGQHDLAPDEAAWIDDSMVITMAELDRYLGTVYARKPEGQQALQQLLEEAIVASEAARAGITASEEDVTAALADLDAAARESGGGGLQDALTADVDATVLRAAMRLHVLQERLVRAEQSLPPDAPLSTAQLRAWMDARVAQAKLVEAPLDDPRAGSFPGGDLPKTGVGERLRAVLPKDKLAGVLTEMIGVQLVRRRAAQLDIDLTPAEVTHEVLLRDAALKAHSQGLDVSYTQYLEQVEHRSLQEMIQSDAFGTEVLLRMITEKALDDEKARAIYEAERDLFARRGVHGNWDEVRLAVWKELRQRAYREMFANSRIVRRF